MIKFLYRLIVLLSGIIFCIGFLVGILLSYLHYWSGTPYGIENAEVKFNLPKGMSLASLASSLEETQLVNSGQSFKVWARVFSNFSEFKAGEYLLQTPIAPSNLAQKFIEGSSYREVKYEVVIPEGFNLNNIIDKFTSLGIGHKSRFEQLASDRNFLASLGIGTSSIEGFLYPATYYFHEVPREEEVFREMVKVFWKRLPQNYESLVASRGLNLYQAVIFASLIEAEAFHDEERELIAEVVWNRLKMNIPLGIDASVIYGIRNFDGNLRKSDLLDPQNPYNLRIKKGLPPTPINTPTIKSLNAVLRPTSHGYLYYVVNPETDKRHTFSKTLAEHNLAVSKLINRK